MAWAVDQATLGTNSSTGNSSTIALTTTNAVAANGWIYLVVGWFNASVTLSSVAGGSLTWTILAGNNSGVRAALVRAQAGAGGLASGTTITATFSGSTGERKIGGASFTGGDGTLQNNTTNSGSGTSWSVGPTVTGNALVVAAASLDTNGTSTADANSTELLDFVVGTASRSFLYYRIGGTPVGGTFSASAAWIAVGASFDDAAGGTGHEQPVDDTASITDTSARAVGKAVADTASVSDQATPTTAYVRQIDDAVSATDAVAKTATHPLSDSIAGTDAQAKTVTHSIAESPTVTDFINTGGSVAHTHEIDETLAGTDALAKSAAHPVSDSASATDAQAKTVTSTLTEAPAATDALNRTWQAVWFISDTLTITDSRDIDWSGAERPWTYDGDQATATYGGTATFNYGADQNWTYTPITG